jgi:DNA-binding LytR/AlgR family response regulator
MSAHKDYGPEAYENDIVYYMEKVITKKKFKKSIEKVKDRQMLSNELKTGIDAGMFTIPGDGKCDYKYLKLEDILYFKAANNYVHVYTTNAEYLTNYKMKRG